MLGIAGVESMSRTRISRVSVTVGEILLDAVARLSGWQIFERLIFVDLENLT